ncbi:hypothetical protein FHQ18_04370 [Deferribacter autotrophicus]|uniref:SCP2 domain-containing protein n=1 Tax=Deferribacter autotrophicus TaxID=500465 RepID=A0A5A8F5M2_9BACT|nr:hypothetical protein [Deferribacter autotrophicus]KAA0258400.1 hypothetical protein FHQ18_04370 [Deferribacter autotrophicus]
MKKFLLKILFFFFKRSLIFLSKHDKNIKDELSNLPENYRIILKIHNMTSPMISLMKVNDKFVENIDTSSADLIVEFKNINSAFLIFTAQKGLEKAFAEKRIILKGLITYGIIFTRISIIVQRYLFPAFICKNIMKHIMPINNMLKIKLYIYGIIKG